MASTQLIAGAPEVSPETIGDARAVELFGEHCERLLPLRESARAVSLLVVDESKAVVHVRPVRRKLERVFVVSDGALSVSSTSVVVSQSQISRGAGGTLLHDARQEIFRIALLRGSEIFAIARSVVEPCVPG